MRLPPGIEILEDHEGSGRVAQDGDEVTYNVRIFLNRGDEVLFNESQLQAGLPQSSLGHEAGRVLVDHKTVLGRRQTIAGIEKALIGMKPGGHRRIRVSPHLAYGEEGVPGIIPPNAVLNVDVWLRDVGDGR